MVENRFKEMVFFHCRPWSRLIKIFPASFNVAWYGEQTVDQRTFSVLSFLYPIYFLISYFRLFLFLSFFLSFFPFLFFLVLSFPLFFPLSLFSLFGLPVPCVPGVPASSRTFFILFLLFYPYVFVCYPFVCYPYVLVWDSYVTRMHSYVFVCHRCVPVCTRTLLVCTRVVFWSRSILSSFLSFHIDYIISRRVF